MLNSSTPNKTVMVETHIDSPNCEDGSCKVRSEHPCESSVVDPDHVDADADPDRFCGCGSRSF